MADNKKSIFKRFSKDDRARSSAESVRSYRSEADNSYNHGSHSPYMTSPPEIMDSPHSSTSGSKPNTPNTPELPKYHHHQQQQGAYPFPNYHSYNQSQYSQINHLSNQAPTSNPRQSSSSGNIKYHASAQYRQHRNSSPGPPTQSESNQNVIHEIATPRNEVLRKSSVIIVGIDFGTTFTGISFSMTSNNPSHSSANRMPRQQLLTEWPGLAGSTQQKVPSVIYYDRSGNVIGWGADNRQAYRGANRLAEGVIKCEWFKLYLQGEQESYLAKANKLPPIPAGKTPVDVVTDFLTRLRGSMLIQMKKTLGDVLDREERHIQYVLTVPAIWSDSGKAATRTAAVKAGFLVNEADDRLKIVTEPEAAALFCTRQGILPLNSEDVFLIVDCGGGTVDLISYEVESVEPFLVNECTLGTGEACGAIFLDRRFYNLVADRTSLIDFFKNNPAMRKRVISKCTVEFASHIKHNFTNNGEDWLIDVGLFDQEIDGIEDGYMTFTNDEIFSVFNPVVKKCMQLLKGQMDAVLKLNRRLKSILVVGGFGASDYLFQEIKMLVGPGLASRVVRPMDAWSAVVQGAVFWGVDDQVITSRIARRHYIVESLTTFVPGKHPEAYKVQNNDGVAKCRYISHSIVDKGQRLEKGQTITLNFFRSHSPGTSLVYEDTLFTSDNDECPTFITSPNLSDINLDECERSSSASGITYYIHFDIMLKLDGSELSASVFCQDKFRGKSRLRFK